MKTVSFPLPGYVVFDGGVNFARRGFTCTRIAVAPSIFQSSAETFKPARISVQSIDVRVRASSLAVQFRNFREGAVYSKTFEQLKEKEGFQHFTIGSGVKFGRKATIIERCLRTLKGMISLDNINSRKQFISDFKRVVHIYNNTW